MTTSTIQWAVGPDLGTYRVSNNYDIPLTVVDSDPSLGPVTYALTSGTLPPYLQLDSTTGYLWGYLEYEPSYIKSYDFSVTATKTYINSSTITTASNFSITVKGFLDENIEWVTTSSLGIINAGYPSDLQLEAVETINNFKVKYDLISGTLPSGLILNNDGAISGQVDYGTTGTYTFTVSALTDYSTISESRTFTLTAVDTSGVEYTKIYIRPFLSKEKRKEWQLFINNPSVFDPNLIYRYTDSNFGVQSDLKMVLDFGIERVPLDQYTQALRQNFYKRRFTLGKVKTAIAQDDLGNTLYEVIYLDVVDNLRTAAMVLYSNRNVSAGTSGGTAGQMVTQPVDTEVDSMYYPASINNMRTQLGRIQLDDWSLIKINRFLEPQYMKTTQPGTGLPSNYIAVVPLCYVKPGQSKPILKKIAAYKFKFNMIDFEIDRMVVQNSLDYSTAKYLLFGRESISDTLVTDVTLYQGDVFWQFDDGVQLTRTS